MASIFKKLASKNLFCGRTIQNVEDSSNVIAEWIKSERPFMISRLGSEESRTVSKWMQHKNYTERNYHNIMYNAGVFPNDRKSLDKFCTTYTESVSYSDMAVVWGCVGEASIIKKYTSPNVILGDVGVYNFLFYENPWTLALESKNVLVVHPFIETIKKQYEKRKLLFDKALLPEFKSLQFVRTVQTNAGVAENSGYESWFAALEYMKTEIAKKDFDIALIGAGAYGMPLSAYCKQLGKQAIYVGGNLQLMFGVRGRRWDNTPQFVPYFNEHWVYPSESETPISKETVEGGSYWK